MNNAPTGTSSSHASAIPITSDTTSGILPTVSPCVSLQQILSNHLISSRIVPHLSIQNLLALASTNHALQTLISTQSQYSSSFQHVNLSQVRRAQLDTNGQRRLSEDNEPGLTEDDFYSRPIKAIFLRLEKRQWLSIISTLILDGLCVPTEIVRHVIMDDRFNMRILSIRDVQQLNISILCQTLKFVTRPSRPKGTPKLQGLYIFGPKEVVPCKDISRSARRRSPTRFVDVSPQEAVRAVGRALGEEWNRRSLETLAKDLENHDDKWYLSAGRVIGRTPHEDWAQTLVACQGIIHFDAVLCRGPRHSPTTSTGNSNHNFLPPAVATVALGSEGCDQCKTCPEGPGTFDQSPSHELPLLAPPPFTVSTIRAAQMPSSSIRECSPRLITRCAECLKGRWCERCHKWWCESCYSLDGTNAAQAVPEQRSEHEHVLTGADTMSGGQTIKMGSKRDCFGCGQTCSCCKELYIRGCSKCNSEYCLIDNDGSSATTCDWCNYSGRRTRELY